VVPLSFIAPTQIHKQACIQCRFRLPANNHFTAAGHPSYLKSARLYLRKMYALKDDNPAVHENFQSGFHVIQRSSQYWAGLGSDLVIEQTLMHSLKSQGRLTQGSGMSKHQRTVWAMSSAVSSTYNFTMQELITKSHTSSEQHKELSASRLRRDETDLGKVAEKLDSFTPFSTNESLRILSQGLMPMRMSMFRTYLKSEKTLYRRWTNSQFSENFSPTFTNGV